MQSLRPAPEDEEAPLGRHPKAMLRFARRGGVVFLLLLVPLGALIAAAAFLLATLPC